MQLIRMQRVQVFSDWCQLVSHHSKVGKVQRQYLQITLNEAPGGAEGIGNKKINATN